MFLLPCLSIRQAFRKKGEKSALNSTQLSRDEHTVANAKGKFPRIEDKGSKSDNRRRHPSLSPPCPNEYLMCSD